MSWIPALLFTLTIAWLLANPDQAADSVGFIMFCVLTSHGVYKLWVAAEASRKFVADRQSGELEVLLTTPLDSRQVWRTYLIRLRQQFLGPMALLLACDGLLLVLGLGRDGWLDENPEFTLPLIALSLALVADSYTAAWVGLWQSLTARSASRAMTRTVLFTIILPGGGFLLLLGSLVVLATSPEQAMLWVTVGWFLVGCATDIGLCGWTMARLGDSFRETVSRPMATNAGN